MAPATVTILYPSKEGSKFDMDYYLNSHLPLVSSRWTSAGMTHWFVTDLRDTKQPYAVQALLVWDTGLDGYNKAVEEHGTELFGDIPNFSSEQPVVLTGVISGKK